MIPQLRIEDFDYGLPPERIAQTPLQKRDHSKLLVYRQGEIRETLFEAITAEIPADSFLVFNETKVVEARIRFKKPTGGMIEVFCLEPAGEYGDISIAMQQKGNIRYKCLIGGASKWKHGMELEKTNGDLRLTAAIAERTEDSFILELSWNNADTTFAEMLHLMGEIPLPPYMNRQPEEADKARYQTVYAKTDGSVAAPTAGLHFTDVVLNSFEKKGITKGYVTLHVGAGTFMPVKANDIRAHVMHSEYIEITDTFIAAVLENLDKKIITVGTTSLRTVESLYWLGLKVLAQPAISPTDLHVSQWDPYELEKGGSAKQSLCALLHWMQERNMGKLVTTTQVIIAPGYCFALADGLITNFHQPRSTLLLLVAALIGDDWKQVYSYALQNSFRFLSYGDSSLLWRS